MPSPIKLLLTKAAEEKVKEKLISNLYKHLQSHLFDNALDLKQKWELVANTIIEDEEWEEACKRGFKITNSPTWKMFNWKVRIRFFRTPSNIFNHDNTKMNLCWRICKQIGDHLALKSFWLGI